jgi:hypothetical protein
MPIDPASLGQRPEIVPDGAATPANISAKARTALRAKVPTTQTAAAKRHGGKTRGAATSGPVASKPRPKLDVDAPEVGRQTKQALLISLLQRPQGATIVELATATGWQNHSVRGAISFALKKKLGLVVTSLADDERGRVYRIGALPKATRGRSKRRP